MKWRTNHSSTANTCASSTCALTVTPLMMVGGRLLHQRPLGVKRMCAPRVTAQQEREEVHQTSSSACHGFGCHSQAATAAAAGDVGNEPSHAALCTAACGPACISHLWRCLCSGHSRGRPPCRSTGPGWAGRGARAAAAAGAAVGWAAVSSRRAGPATAEQQQHWAGGHQIEGRTCVTHTFHRRTVAARSSSMPPWLLRQKAPRPDCHGCLQV